MNDITNVHTYAIACVNHVRLSHLNKDYLLTYSSTELAIGPFFKTRPSRRSPSCPTHIAKHNKCNSPITGKSVKTVNTGADDVQAGRHPPPCSPSNTFPFQ